MFLLFYAEILFWLSLNINRLEYGNRRNKTMVYSDQLVVLNCKLFVLNYILDQSKFCKLILICSKINYYL